MCMWGRPCHMCLDSSSHLRFFYYYLFGATSRRNKTKSFEEKCMVKILMMIKYSKVNRQQSGIRTSVPFPLKPTHIAGQRCVQTKSKNERAYVLCTHIEIDWLKINIGSCVVIYLYQIVNEIVCRCERTYASARCLFYRWAAYTQRQSKRGKLFSSTIRVRVLRLLVKNRKE